MKIIFLTNKPLIGGTERIMIHQANLMSTRHDVYLGFLFKTTRTDNLEDQIKLDSSRVINLNLNGIFDLFGIFRFAGFLRRQKIDIIYSGLFEANFIARLAGILAGTKVIVTSEHSCNYDRKLWQKKADKLLSIRTDLIITYSQEVANYTSKQENIPLKKFKTINQICDLALAGTINTEKFRRDNNIPENVLIAAFIGRFSPEKAPGRVIEIADIVINKNNQKNIFFLLAGAGDIEPELRSNIEARNLSGNVILIVDPRRAREYLAVSDILLITSLVEGTPLILLEAFYNGVPAIATPVGIVPEIMRDGRGGYIVGQDDMNGFAEKIIDLASDPEKFRTLKSDLRSLALKYTGSINELEKIFLNLLNK